LGGGVNSQKGFKRGQFWATCEGGLFRRSQEKIPEMGKILLKKGWISTQESFWSYPGVFFYNELWGVYKSTGEKGGEYQGGHNLGGNL